MKSVGLIQIPCLCRDREISEALESIEDMRLMGYPPIIGITGSPLVGRDAFCRKLISRLDPDGKKTVEEIDAETFEGSIPSADIVFLRNAGLNEALLNDAKMKLGSSSVLIFTCLCPPDSIKGLRTLEIGWLADEYVIEFFRSICERARHYDLCLDDLKGLSCFDNLHDPALLSVLAYCLDIEPCRSRDDTIKAIEDWQSTVERYIDNLGLMNIMDALEKHLDTLVPDNPERAKAILDVLSMNGSHKPCNKPLLDRIGVGSKEDCREVLKRLEDLNLVEIDHLQNKVLELNCRMPEFLRVLWLSHIRRKKDGSWPRAINSVIRAFVLIENEESLKGGVKERSHLPTIIYTNDRLMLQQLRYLMQYCSKNDFEGYLDGLEYCRSNLAEINGMFKAGFVPVDSNGAIITAEVEGVYRMDGVRWKHSSGGGDVLDPAGHQFVGGLRFKEGSKGPSRWFDVVVWYAKFLYAYDVVDGAGTSSTDLPLKLHDFLKRSVFDPCNDAASGSRIVSQEEIMEYKRLDLRLLCQGLGIAFRGMRDEVENYIDVIRESIDDLEKYNSEDYRKTLTDVSRAQLLPNAQAILLAKVETLNVKNARRDLASDLDFPMEFNKLFSEFDKLLKDHAGATKGLFPDRIDSRIGSRKDIKILEQIDFAGQGLKTDENYILDVPSVMSISVYGFMNKFFSLAYRSYGQYLMEVEPEEAVYFLRESANAFARGGAHFGQANVLNAQAQCMLANAVIGYSANDIDGFKNSLKEADEVVENALKAASITGVKRTILNSRVLQARIRINQGKLEDASAIISMLRATPDLKQGTLLRLSYGLDSLEGDFYKATGKFDRAIEAYRRADKAQTTMFSPWERMTTKSKIYELLMMTNQHVPEELSSELVTYSKSSLFGEMRTSSILINRNLSCSWVSGRPFL
ncbi:MAG: hypothetical protein Q4Q62_01485 [Thermoplasmata archaeon]|nr:hypothetical protein [Thermoplasmata archaeon]